MKDDEEHSSPTHLWVMGHQFTHPCCAIKTSRSSASAVRRTRTIPVEKIPKTSTREAAAKVDTGEHPPRAVPLCDEEHVPLCDEEHARTFSGRAQTRGHDSDASLEGETTRAAVLFDFERARTGEHPTRKVPLFDGEHTRKFYEVFDQDSDDEEVDIGAPDGALDAGESDTQDAGEGAQDAGESGAQDAGEGAPDAGVAGPPDTAGVPKDDCAGGVDVDAGTVTMDAANVDAVVGAVHIGAAGAGAAGGSAPSMVPWWRNDSYAAGTASTPRTA